MTRKILVTGFGPFPGQQTNPTLLALAELPRVTEGQIQLCGHGGAQTGRYGVYDTSMHYCAHIETHHLTVDANGAVNVAERLQSGERWSAIVHAGVDKSVNRPRAELTAYNRLAFSQPDIQNRLAHGPIVERGPLEISSHEIVMRLCTGLPATWSSLQRIGEYVCNETFFRTLECIQRLNLDIPAVFLHVPDTDPRTVAKWFNWWIERLGRPVRTVVAGVALRRSDGAIYAAHRRDHPSDCGWEFPGGKRRIAESLEQTAIREAGEELGIELRGPGLPVGVVCGEIKGREYELHIFEHQCDVEPVLGIDHDEGRWLEPSELLDVPWLELDVPLIQAMFRA